VTTKNPNAILHRIRSSVATLSQNSPAATPPAVRDLIQAITDLDNHLSWGGTPPDEWGGASFAASVAQAQISRVRAPAPRPWGLEPSSRQTRALLGHEAQAREAHESDPVEDLMRRM
jgi:hypothetical protein